jgi:YD repeat-containing protein
MRRKLGDAGTSLRKSGVGQKQFWHPPLWKWSVVLLLVAGAAWLAFRKPAPRPAEVVKVELLPFSDTPPAWDGAYPFVVISMVDHGPGGMQFKGRVEEIKPTVRHDSPVDEFQVDLHTGKFVLRQTDFFLPDVTPLSLTRTYRVWDCCARAFGMGTNHPYDICPTGTRFPYTYTDLNLEDGWQVHFRRISKGTGYADAVFRHEDTASEFYGAQDAWNGDGWTLTFRDGRRFFFPEAYYSKTYAQGAAVEMRDAEDHRIQLKRDKRRNLAELISQSGRKITFKYDAQDRIVEAADDAGKIRRYSYDFSGHLESVSDASHVLYRFEYAPLLHWEYDNFLMTTILDGNWKVLARNAYADRSRISEQTLADGTVYRYEYVFDAKHEIVETTVTMPGGARQKFFFEKGFPVKERQGKTGTD